MKIPDKLPGRPYWGAVTMLIFSIILYHNAQDHLKNEATQAAMIPVFHRTVSTPTLPEGVGQMLPPRRNVFCGGQLNATQLTNFLATYQIDHVIDLAHEAAAEKLLSQQAERFIVEKTGATYWPLNIEGSNNRLNQKALAVVDSLLDLGDPVFIHCLHGIHRVGVAKGRAYARDLRRWNEIVALLRWEKVIGNSVYDRYTNDVWEQVQQRNQPPHE